MPLAISTNYCFSTALPEQNAKKMDKYNVQYS